MVLGRQDYQWQHEPILYGWKPGKAHRWHGGRKQTTLIEDDRLSIQETDDGFVVSIGGLVLKVPSYEAEESTIWRIPKPTRNAEHPTMKPVALVERAIRNSSKRGQIVLDPFAGSGSTLAACEVTGRIFAGCEIDPRYVDVCVARWENLTGRKAEREVE